MDSNFKVKLISESNNTYEFSIESDYYFDTIFIYAPNYKTALSRVNKYIQSQEVIQWIIYN